LSISVTRAGYRGRDPGPGVILARCLTVAKVDSMVLLAATADW